MSTKSILIVHLLCKEFTPLETDCMKIFFRCLYVSRINRKIIYFPLFVCIPCLEINLEKWDIWTEKSKYVKHQMSSSGPSSFTQKKYEKNEYKNGKASLSGHGTDPQKTTPTQFRPNKVQLFSFDIKVNIIDIYHREGQSWGTDPGGVDPDPTFKKNTGSRSDRQDKKKRARILIKTFALISQSLFYSAIRKKV